MVKKYLPKIKAATAKKIAQSLLSTTKGKKISDSKFKKILKSDKSLQKDYYKSKNSSYTQMKAKGFFNRVLASAKDSKAYKINKIAAKKMGIRVGSDQKVSELGIKKIYQRATNEELEAQKPQGPTPQEIEREKRIEKARQTMHKWQRAKETENDPNLTPNSQATPSQPAEPTRKVAPPERTIGMVGQTVPTIQNNNQKPSLAQKTDSAGQSQKMPDSELIRPTLLITPLNNLTPHLPSLEINIKKLNRLYAQKLEHLKIFEIIPKNIITQALKRLNYDAYPEPADEKFIIAMAKLCGAELYCFGFVRKERGNIEVNINIINVKTKKKLNITQVQETADDLFKTERKMAWQIENTLLSSSAEKGGPPSPAEATDLPI